jgi:hypothetical protein
MDQSTYNNYSTSELIFWFQTVIPFLTDLGDQLTFSLRDELKPGERILPDISDIPAVRKAVSDKAKTAEVFHKMGVPFKQINQTFNLGFEEFDGWEESHPYNTKDEKKDGEEDRGSRRFLGSPIIINTGDPSALPESLRKAAIGEISQIPENQIPQGDLKYHLREFRADDLGEAAAAQREEILESEIAPKLNQYFDDLRKDIMKDVEENDGSNTDKIIQEHREELEEVLEDIWVTYGVELGKDVVMERASITEDLEGAIRENLDQEHIIMTEAAFIDQTTSSLVLDQIEDAMATGADMATLQQAIMDVGAFSSERALRIGRTALGSSSSLGQMLAARMSGATRKIWNTAMFEVRDEHKERRGEEVGIDERFSAKFGMFKGPRYPLDPQLVPADRVNCRCSLSFR